jgi:hypothetical protein
MKKKILFVIIALGLAVLLGTIRWLPPLSLLGI